MWPVHLKGRDSHTGESEYYVGKFMDRISIYFVVSLEGK